MLPPAPISILSFDGEMKKHLQATLCPGPGSLRDFNTNISKELNMKTEFETSKKANLATLADYANEAVVSKTLINKDTGTVTLFAFDAGQGLSEHTAPFDAMVQVVDGEAAVIIDGKEHVVKAGEFIIMPASIPHALEAKKRFKMLLTMIKPK